MIRIDDLVLYTRVAALGSFTAAANECGMEPANVSAAVRRLEEALNTSLVQRSTRSLRLTEEGLRYLPFAQSIIDRVQDSARELLAADEAVSGTIRIGVPSDLGRNLLADWLADFKSAHPAVHLEMIVGDDAMDVFREPIDAAVRYDAELEGNHVALPVSLAHRRVLVASPRYLDEQGVPQAIGDLASHACLVSTQAGQPRRRWRFPGAVPSFVDVQETRSSDDEEVLRSWAVEGDGIAYKAWLDVAEDVAGGRLAVVLPGEATEELALTIACANRQQVSPALRELHRWLADRCEAFLLEHPLPCAEACVQA